MTNDEQRMTKNINITLENKPIPEVSQGSILIVDDQPSSLRLLTNLLTDHGYEVRSAINGVAALKTVQAVLPDLVLLDITMPQMNGYEVCQQLKADPKTCDIPVIFISALDDSFDKVKAFSVGGIDYITKPFHVEEVLARIENRLGNIRLQKQLQLSEAREREKSQKLAQALQRIQNAQCQFHSEKMSSLGRLVAGVAHEINNPIGFIFSNLHHATEYIRELLRLLDLYQQAFPEATPLLREEIQTIDLEFIKSDLPKLLESMKVGSERISQLVQSLRLFSRLDEAKIKAIDIHEGIESTLIILQHRLKLYPNYCEIQVVKDYADLPAIECFPGPINQVFMNIISNAIDALEERLEVQGLYPNPMIKIRTIRLDQERVAISITDNGGGITEMVQQLLFDPFFTTKPVGKGTGLGLSISYQIIVEQHHGKLYCNSQLDQGTEFVIELPINQLTTQTLT